MQPVIFIEIEVRVVIFPKYVYQGRLAVFGLHLVERLVDEPYRSVSVPIFNNRQTKSAVQKAKIQKQNSELDLLDNQKNLYKTIEGLWLDANSAQQRYVAAIEKLRSTQTSYDLIQEQFNLGMKNTVELLTEKNNLLNAQQETLQAKYMAILNTQLLKFYQGEQITL